MRGRYWLTENGQILIKAAIEGRIPEHHAEFIEYADALLHLTGSHYDDSFLYDSDVDEKTPPLTVKQLELMKYIKEQIPELTGVERHLKDPTGKMRKRRPLWFPGEDNGL